MTPPETYTAYLNFELSQVPPFTDHTGTYLSECPELDANRATVANKRMAARLWTYANGHSAHYLNDYDNSCHFSGQGQIAVVFSDRNAAVMMKLALQN
ncbi:hypothetical protein [Novosphingobium guangzhouense]|uniref:Uncharacterized protein n=1 Tax=Novosphingobium guangzhouense TaxID=1850347 RepID=A0A2K2G0P4_9SPHN|nr:hypothetical protein [Novosphingobium guangzhouense]PNU04597.1 hypothetical protein A8V01_19505 [Novosphingobium guangzhouense]